MLAVFCLPLSFLVPLPSLLGRSPTCPSPRPAADRDERGQASAEYALVVLGAAAVALLVVAWATRTNLVGSLLDAVFRQLRGKVG